jgi:hypothetical protein
MATPTAPSHYNAPNFTPAQIEAFKARAAKEGWTHTELVMLDVWLNTLAFWWLPHYKAFQTMSSHFQMAADSGDRFAQMMTWMLDEIQAGHGVRAEAGDDERDQASDRQLDESLGQPPDKETP